MSALRAGVAVCLVAALVICPALALAQRPATSVEFRAINRTLSGAERSLGTTLDWVKVSTRGPYALAYLKGREQVSATVLEGAVRRWRVLATISDEGLRCGLVPVDVIADLHLEQYNDGPKPCSE